MREDLSAGRSVNGEHRLWSDRPQRGCTGSPGKVPGGRDPPWATLPGGTARPLWGPHLREHSHTRGCVLGPKGFSVVVGCCWEAGLQS